MNAVDDGIINGSLNLADICFLIAVIVFVIAAVMAYGVKTLWATLVAAGLAAASLGLLLL